MIEEVIKNYLEAKLVNPAVPVYLMEPIDKPEEYVLIERTGGGIENWIEFPTLAIKSCSKTSLYAAAALNERLKPLMLAAPGEIDVSRVKLNTDYNNTNTQTKVFRYQAVYDIVF